MTGCAGSTRPEWQSAQSPVSSSDQKTQSSHDADRSGSRHVDRLHSGRRSRTRCCARPPKRACRRPWLRGPCTVGSIRFTRAAATLGSPSRANAATHPETTLSCAPSGRPMATPPSSLAGSAAPPTRCAFALRRWASAAPPIAGVGPTPIAREPQSRGARRTSGPLGPRHSGPSPPARTAGRPRALTPPPRREHRRTHAGREAARAARTPARTPQRAFRARTAARTHAHRAP